MNNRLKIAIQKSGRLSEQSKKLLRDCGIRFSNGKQALIASSGNFPLDLLYLRDDDIPRYVEDGTADIGILGENVLIESALPLRTVRKLGFARCRLSLAIPKSENYNDPAFFEGRKIATSYPKILTNFLNDKGINANIHRISGSVEIAPNIGLADAVCDIVSSGSTLFSNGLKEVERILESEAILIARDRLPAEKEVILESLLFRLESVLQAQANKYVVLNAPNDKLESISNILPGMRSPTVVPLAEKGWSALHSVLPENLFWNLIDELRQAGAEGILVMPIEKMIR
ncbi:MAG: ATP phosphoribosyltransferase [Bacteroidetes bacterium]|nr:ATP phosphoribosyltransferase [Bacteroidota bacterium]